VTLTGSAVIGDVGSGLPFPGSAVTLTDSTVDGGVHVGDAFAVQAYGDFFTAYDALAAVQCGSIPLDTVYTDATLTLPPGVYCNTAAVTFTRTTLTLDAQGDPNAVWIFKIGTLGPALSRAPASRWSWPMAGRRVTCIVGLTGRDTDDFETQRKSSRGCGRHVHRWKRIRASLGESRSDNDRH